MMGFRIHCRKMWHLGLLDILSWRILMKQQKQEGHSALLPPPLFPESESPWNFPGQNTGVGSILECGGIPIYWNTGVWRSLFPSPGDLLNLGMEPRSPTLQVDSLTAEPQGKPKKTGAGSLSLLQGVFPTQESNQGLLHCRRILHQLSHREA